MKFLQCIFLFLFIFGYSQHYSEQEKDVLMQAEKLDSLMKNNDDRIIDLLCSDVSFGHSNGWIQNLSDFKKDFKSKKVIYKEIRQDGISELKQNKNTFSIRRTVNVVGNYSEKYFEMKLALLEIWIKNKSIWKLWSRQSIEIKP